jgi:hypothetical protein
MHKVGKGAHGTLLLLCYPLPPRLLLRVRLRALCFRVASDHLEASQESTPLSSTLLDLRPRQRGVRIAGRALATAQGRSRLLAGRDSFPGLLGRTTSVGGGSETGRTTEGGGTRRCDGIEDPR